MVLLFSTTYINVDLALYEIYRAKVGKGGILYLCVWGKTYKTRACADIHCVYTAAYILLRLDAKMLLFDFHCMCGRTAKALVRLAVA